MLIKKRSKPLPQQSSERFYFLYSIILFKEYICKSLVIHLLFFNYTKLFIAFLSNNLLHCLFYNALPFTYPLGEHPVFFLNTLQKYAVS